MNRRRLMWLHLILAVVIGICAGLVGSDGSRAVVADVCPPVSNTPFFTIVYGTVTLDEADAPVGTVVEAHSPRDDVVGCFVVSGAGNYGAMYVYGEDTSVSPPLPGMRSGEVIGFRVKGSAATASPELAWSNDHDLHQVNLSATSAHGSIIVEKQTNPDGDETSFTFSGDASGSIKDGEQIVVADLPPGTYASQETVPLGWDLISIECDDANSTGDLNSKTATFQLDASETVKCTFTNSRQYSRYDFDHDCDIDVADIMAVASRWRTSCDDPDPDNNPETPNYEALYDLDDDCDVDIVDIMTVASRWGCQCGDECYYGAQASAASQVAARLLAVSPTVRLVPDSSMVASGETFTVAVKMEGTVDLGGFQLALNFDPAVVQVADVVLGDYLGTTGRSVVPLGPEMDNVAGVVTFGGFSFGEQVGAYGDGELATITLSAIWEGSSPLSLEDVLVVDAQGRTQSVTVEGVRLLAGMTGCVYLPMIVGWSERARR